MNGLIRTMSGNLNISIQTAGRRPMIRQGIFPLLFELTKIRLSLYMGVSGAAGFVLAQTGPPAGAVAAGFWIVLLAAGSAVVNNIQDRFYDKGFERTRGRAMPCAMLSLPKALTLAVFFSLTGLAGLCHLSYMAGGLGAAALMLYNGIYTPLKKNIPCLPWCPGPFAACCPRPLAGLRPFWDVMPVQPQ
ncbi:MAG: UbiA family prenyltransferase [Desulfobacterales bacterium]|nr:UbiA family prenyltransferase [Desulfobacterales bacterium]